MEEKESGTEGEVDMDKGRIPSTSSRKKRGKGDGRRAETRALSRVYRREK